MMPTVNDSELFRQMLLQVIDSSAAKRWEP